MKEASENQLSGGFDIKWSNLEFKMKRKDKCEERSTDAGSDRMKKLQLLKETTKIENENPP